MKSHLSSLLAAVALACLTTGAAQADVKAGVDAWSAKRFDEAVKEWRPLAEKGDPDAQFNMGQAYKLGRGVPADLKLAQTWYEKAAQQGHAQAQANLGLILFQNGDRASAMPWIQKASGNGDPRAQYVLGTALFNGDMIAKDWPRAYALMTRAAAQGLPQAATSLAEMDTYIPLADRQKGIAIAKQLEGSGIVPASTPTKPSATQQTRVASAAGPVTAPVAPRAKPAVAKPVAAAAKPPASVVQPKSPASYAAAGGKWRVQLGAYGSSAIARGQWGTISKRVSVLAGLQPTYEAAGAFTRLRVGPLASRAAANQLCAAAKASGQACFPIAP